MIYFIVAAVILLLDQAAAYFMTLYLTPGVSVSLIPGILRLTYQENTGAAFSFMSDMRWVLVGVSAVVIAAIAVGMIKYRDNIDVIGKLALACVLGGAASHLFDRAVLGYVVDYFEFEFVRFAVMDVADWFITIGGIVFCLNYLIHTKNDDGKDFFIGKRKKPKTVTAEDNDAAVSADSAPEDDGNDGNDKT